MQTVVVGVDGSEGSDAAVRWAAAYAKGIGATVVAISVLTSAWELDAFAFNTDRLRREVAHLLDTDWTEPFRAAGVTLRTIVREGNPASEVCQVANDVHADLLVVGHTGHEGFRERLLGGTTHKLLVRPSVPIVVVPAPEGS